MKHKVSIISDAEEDIFDIYKYIAINDSIEQAEAILTKIEGKILQLSELANRGHEVSELSVIGVGEYQEIYIKPYRIIYQIIDDDVFVHCVLDARRDLEELLRERLIR